MPRALERAIGPESAGILLTPGVFDALRAYDENYRYQFVHEVLVVSPIPNGSNGVSVGYLSKSRSVSPTLVRRST